MPVQLNPDASFSSKQELPELQDCPLIGGLSPNAPSSEDCQTGSHGESRHRVPRSASVPVELHTVEHSLVPEAPGDVELVSTDPDPLCGWGSLTPKVIQVFKTPRWVLFFLTLVFFIHESVNDGFINAAVTSIERRFDLNSSEVGLIVSTYDITLCVCLAFVSYFGGRGHKPHWLGWGILSMSMGCLLFALPHFIAPSYQDHLPEQTGMCVTNQTIRAKEAEDLSSYRFIFMLAQVLLGISGSSLNTLAITYLDENVKPDYAPIYTGIYQTAGGVGAALGFLLGGYFLNIYTDINQATEMTPDSPHWVGAWWISFPWVGAAALLLAVPILAYPRQLPGSQEFASQRGPEVQEPVRSQGNASDPQCCKVAKDMFSSVLILLTNVPFLFLCLASATETVLFVGVSTFGPKFLELQFNQTASDAVIYFGYLLVPAGAGGTFLGSYIVKRWNLSCRAIVRFCMLCGLVSLSALFVFLIHCPTVSMAGVNVPYRDHLTESQQLDQHNLSSLKDRLTAGCNSHCHCDTELYDPVCGADGITYYSPCFAGCTSINEDKDSTGKKVYSGCSCVVGNVSWGDKGLALGGKCPSSCLHLLAFLSPLFIVIFFTTLTKIPALMATLSCVPHREKSFALGIQWIFVFMLGRFPGPLVFGSIIDLSCLLWEVKGDDWGSCYLYHNKSMGLYTLAVGVISKVLGMVFFMFAGIMHQPLPEAPKKGLGPGTGMLSNLSEDDIVVNVHAGHDVQNEPSSLISEK